MPVIQIVTNVTAELAAKRSALTELTAVFAEEIKIPAGHVHIHIMDGQCFAFGGDPDSPAAFITIKATTLQIWPEKRKVLVERMIPLLHRTMGILPSSTTTMFQELPVENIAVGTSIATFASPRSSMSPDHLKVAV